MSGFNNMIQALGVQATEGVFHYQWVPQTLIPIYVQYIPYVYLATINKVLWSAVAIFNVYSMEAMLP